MTFALVIGTIGVGVTAMEEEIVLNKHGLVIAELMEEYADDIMMLELLEFFMDSHLPELVCLETESNLAIIERDYSDYVAKEYELSLYEPRIQTMYALTEFGIMSTSTTLVPPKTTGSYRMGDVDGNNRIDIHDSSEILKYVAGMNSTIYHFGTRTWNQRARTASMVTVWALLTLVNGNYPILTWNRGPRTEEATDIQRFIAGQRSDLKTLWY